MFTVETYSVQVICEQKVSKKPQIGDAVMSRQLYNCVKVINLSYQMSY